MKYSDLLKPLRNRSLDVLFGKFNKFSRWMETLGPYMRIPSCLHSSRIIATPKRQCPWRNDPCSEQRLLVIAALGFSSQNCADSKKRPRSSPVGLARRRKLFGPGRYPSVIYCPVYYRWGGADSHDLLSERCLCPNPLHRLR